MKKTEKVMKKTEKDAGDKLLEDILENPGDTGLRLIYADWLEDQGEADRAEFIRVQCEVASWKPYKAPPEIAEIASSGRLYAASAVRLLAQQEEEHNARRDGLRRREQEYLNAAGRLGWLPWDVPGWPTSSSGWKFIFRRGFVASVHAPLARLYGPESILPALVQAHPIEEARPTDRRPHQYNGSSFPWYCWSQLTSPVPACHLPVEVRELVARAHGCEVHGPWLDFLTKADAFSALSDALLSLARTVSEVEP